MILGVNLETIWMRNFRELNLAGAFPNTGSALPKMRRVARTASPYPKGVLGAAPIPLMAAALVSTHRNFPTCAH